MAMSAAEIETAIRAALPDADVKITDLAGDGAHYAAAVVSGAFKGKTRVQQHKMVYDELAGRMGGQLHALSLPTAPKDGPLTLAPVVLTSGSRERDEIQMSSNTVHDRIAKDISETDVLLYMKG